MIKSILLVAVVFAVALTANIARAETCQLLTGDGITVTVCLTDAQATPTPSPTVPATPATPQPTATPAPTATPDGPGQISLTGIWISSAELSTLPMSGPAWADLQSWANKSCTPNLSDQDDLCNVATLAKALVFARTGQVPYRDGVFAALRTVVSGNTENGGRTLALGRELAAYVISADLVALKTSNPSLDVVFRAKLRELLGKTLDGRTLRSTHEDRPNNWGTMAGASRAAVAVYLDDKTELERTAQVFRGYLGDRGAYVGFEYGELSWQCDASSPVGINPAGCQKQGHTIDGVMPDDLRRGGSFRWPPTETGYPWEGLQGAVVQAEILHRAGYPAWQWSDRAVCRAVQFLYSIGWSPSGDDMWQAPIVNQRCGTSFGTNGLGSPGKNMGFAGFTHQATAGALIEPQAQMSPALATDQRIVVGSDPVALAEEVEYLMSLGWRVTGDVQQSSDEDGNSVYSQVLVR